MKSFEAYVETLSAKETTLSVEMVDWYEGRQACLLLEDGEPFCALTEENDKGYDEEALAAIASHYLATGDADCGRVLRKAYAKEEEA